MASQTRQGLRRVVKSIPLPTLNQGASLSIRSQVPRTSLHIASQWRDDGHLDFVRTFAPNHESSHMFLSVSQLEDRMTSMGRTASHLTVDLGPSKGGGDAATSTTYACGPDDVSKEETKVDIPSDTTDSNEPVVQLSVVVPEKVNIDVDLEKGGNISVASKIEGDIELRTSDGSIKVKKLRGHKLKLESFGDNALVHATELLEAQEMSILSSGRLRAKQLHGSSINVQIVHSKESKADFEPLEQDDDAALIDISSVFVAGNGACTLSVASARPVKKAIRLKNNHGPVRLATDGVHQPIATDPNTGATHPLIELGGVNGNCEVMTSNTVADADSSSPWKSCLVHVDSLSPDTVSLLTVDQGDISLTIDRKVESDVRLLSLSSKECLVEASSMIAEEENAELLLEVVKNIPAPSNATTNTPKLNVLTKTFNERAGGTFESEHLCFKDGWVENNSAEPPSRFDRKVRGETAIGKINIDSAADQALRGFGQDEKDASGVGTEFPRPLLAAACAGGIQVETVSWLGAIARRYGLDEGGRDLGRQATRRGRPLQPPPSAE